jgi:hypothetical protein
MTFVPVKGWVAIALSTPLLISCGSTVTVDIPNGTSTPSSSTPAPSSSAAPAAATPAAAPAIAPGTYCFNGRLTINGSLVDSAFQLTIAPDNQVTGVSVDAVYTDESADWWSEAFYFEVQGTLNGTTLPVTLVTYEVGDRYEETDQWTLQANTLTTSAMTYNLVDCEAIAEQYPPGWLQVVTGRAPASEPAATTPMPRDIQTFSAADVAPNEFAPTASDILPPWVTNTNTFRVQFEPGSDRAFVFNDINRDEAHSYELRARAGQILDIAFSAMEDGSFSVFAPTGIVMVRENQDTAALQLPIDGDYYISVSTSANRDNYSVAIRIIDP